MTKVIDDNKWDRSIHGPISINDKNLTRMRSLLDKQGGGFCLAKWNQVTIHLGTGMTHSCHHPTMHKIPLHEIEKNPAALHNTLFKKEQRKKMLDGEKPAECDYCWRIEENKNFSDRQYKSMEPWALGDYEEIREMSGDEDVYPSYLEVSFSNVCNMKCTYCGPEASSQWVDDIKQKGPVLALEKTQHEQWTHGWQKNIEDLNYKNREFNPYIDAWWKWFPEAYKHLKIFRITGGEPLLSKETFRTIDWLLENPNPELEFNINTNLCVPDKVWDQFINKIAKLKDSENIKKFTVYTSVEGWGKRAEYGRTGLDFNLWKKRYEQLVSMGNIRCVIMATFNIFSVTSFHKLLAWNLSLRKRYNCNPPMKEYERLGWNVREGTSNVELANRNNKHSSIVALDVPYLRHPSMLDAQLITNDLVEDFLFPTLDYMSDNMSEPHLRNHQGFEPYEIDKFRRIVLHRLHYNKPVDDEDLTRYDLRLARAKFYDFINIMDKRNKTNFIETFPEMSYFWKICKKAHTDIMEEEQKQNEK